MISIIAQERLLGAALGTLSVGLFMFVERQSISRSISDDQSQLREPIHISKSTPDLAHLWNKAVDQTLGPVVVSLSSRRW